MAWIAVDKNDDEYIFEKKPLRSYTGYWNVVYLDYEDRDSCCLELPRGSIKKLIGRELTFEDEPVELKKDSV